MEMHQVRYFLALCDTLNFTRAAERCNVAQPSLTRAIGNLEKELGGELFRRERSRTHLTELGRLVQRHMQDIQAATEAARDSARHYAKLDTAPLRLGMMCTISPVRVIGFLRRMRKELPGVDIALRETRGTALVEELHQGELDVALLALPSFPERFDARPLFSERYVVAFAPGHRFEAMNAVPLEALAGEAYLQRLNCEFPQYRMALEQQPKGAPRLVYGSEREDWIQAMLMAGMGCAIMPESLPLVPGIATRPLIEPEMSRTVSLVTVSGRRFPPPLAEFIRMVQRHDWEALG